MTHQKVLRLIDANLNRAKEGLRVCEDILRFIYDDRKLTSAFKRLRHRCTQVILSFPISYRSLVLARDSDEDVGKRDVVFETKSIRWLDLLASNMKRTEESLRVLEESSKLLARAQSKRFQSLRFQLYELERKVFKKF